MGKPIVLVSTPEHPQSALEVLAVEVASGHAAAPLELATPMQHTPVVENQHFAGSQQVPPLELRIGRQAVEGAYGFLKLCHFRIRKPKGSAVVVVEGDLHDFALQTEPQHWTAGE